MNFYKSAVCTLTLFALSFTAAPAFALDAGEFAGKIAESAQNIYQNQPQEQFSEKDIQLAQLALEEGMRMYQAHLFNGNLTETDKEIEKMLDETFPAILK